MTAELTFHLSPSLITLKQRRQIPIHINRKVHYYHKYGIKPPPLKCIPSNWKLNIYTHVRTKIKRNPVKKIHPSAKNQLKSIFHNQKKSIFGHPLYQNHPKATNFPTKPPKIAKQEKDYVISQEIIINSRST